MSRPFCPLFGDITLKYFVAGLFLGENEGYSTSSAERLSARNDSWQSAVCDLLALTCPM
jgi:hypothetical protein